MSFNRRMAKHGQPVYLRWLGEMNNCDNAYSSRRCNGSRRNSDHSPANFKQAWRRAVLIVRGGDVATINGELSSLGMRPVNTGAAALPMPQVAFIWSPMTGGSPMIPALRPEAFWPGAEYVDWVGTSFYSKYPNFRFLTPYYKKFAVGYRKPFAFVEWAIWDSENPSFVREFFSWVDTHRLTQMISYNHGSASNGPFELTRYPRSAAVIRSKVSSARFLAWAPEWRSD
jgi:beta-mannanase